MEKQQQLTLREQRDGIFSWQQKITRTKCEIGMMNQTTLEKFENGQACLSFSTRKIDRFL
jgi:hypothetical protein